MSRAARLLLLVVGGVLFTATGWLWATVENSPKATAKARGCAQPEPFANITQGLYRHAYLATGASGCAWVKHGAERCWERVARCPDWAKINLIRKGQAQQEAIMRELDGSGLGAGLESVGEGRGGGW